MNQKKKKTFRFPITLKTILIIVLFGVVLVEIAMIFFTISNSNNNKKTYKNIATNLANTVALTVDIEKAETLTNKIVEIYDSYGDEKPTRETEGTAIFEDYMAKIATVKETQVYKDIQSFLLSIKNANVDTDGVYLGYVDFERKYTLYLCYDTENEVYPTGMIDNLYEEDYPIIENKRLGFVASIYEAEVDGEYLCTAGAPVIDESITENDGVVCYALVDISMTMARKKQASSIIRLFVYLTSTVLLLTGIGILIVHFIFIKPVKTLQNAAKSYDVTKPKETHEKFSKLKLYVHDELSDLAENMKQMENDVHTKINELTHINKELIASQKMTEQMKELANKDALTGVRNKIAYDNEVEELNKKIKEKQKLQFGIAMVDLNYLKNINDDYGHDRGDFALVKLCNIICTIFSHSPVYRIGGDEFVIIFKGKDYNDADKLIDEFNKKIEGLVNDEYLLPAEKVSAAIGYSKYDSHTDTCVDDVFKRADQAMYTRKREMKEMK